MSERQTWLRKKFGIGGDKEIRGGLQEVQRLLDKEGVERKSIEIVQKDAHAIAEALVSRIIDKMAEAGVIDAAVQSNAAADIQNPADVTKIAAEAALEVIEEVTEEPVEEKSEHEDEEEKALKTLVVELQASNKSLAEAFEVAIQDQGDMAKSLIEIVPVLKGLAENNVEAMGRIKALEGLVTSRPRQASKSDDTAFEDAEAEAKVKEALAGELSVLGIPVKE